jgi:hypothetical protein
LKRREAAEALQKIGRPISYKTLNTLASRGGGPPYRTFGGFTLYEWGALLAWTERRMTATRTTASEGQALAERIARNRASCQRRDARNKALRAERRTVRLEAKAAITTPDPKAKPKRAQSKASGPHKAVRQLTAAE